MKYASTLVGEKERWGLVYFFLISFSLNGCDQTCGNNEKEEYVDWSDQWWGPFESCDVSAIRMDGVGINLNCHSDYHVFNFKDTY